MKKSKLSKQKIDFFKKNLLENKARIIGDVEHLENSSLRNSQRDSSGDISGWSTHMADAGSDAAERETMLELAASEQKIVEKINHALKRLDEGLYGLCELCNGEISEDRLNAIADSTVCMKCMDKYNL